jgi:hypothetical protein
MAETLPMSRTTTTDAFEGLTTCVDLMVTLKAPKTSPPSPTLEGETTLETFLSKQRRRLPTRAAASANFHPAFLALFHLTLHAQLDALESFIFINSFGP